MEGVVFEIVKVGVFFFLIGVVRVVLSFLFIGGIVYEVIWD